MLAEVPQRFHTKSTPKIKTDDDDDDDDDMYVGVGAAATPTYNWLHKTMRRAEREQGREKSAPNY